MTSRTAKICALLSVGVSLLSAGELSAQMFGGDQSRGQYPAGQTQGQQGQQGQTRPGQTAPLPGSTTTQPGQEDMPFFGEGTEAVPGEDTIKKKRPKKPLESYFFDDSVRSRQNFVWTVDPERNHIYIDHIDTLQDNFQIQYPFMKKGVGSAYLGNLGAPAIPLSFFDQQHDHHPLFAAPWSAYLRTPEQMPFYNVKKPFTQLNYAMAGQKARQEEDLGVIFAQNISPQTGFNIDYRSLGTRGIYSWQSTRDKSLSLGFQHTGKRYTIHAGYIWNSIYNRENGGMVDDNDLIVNFNDFELSSVMPMRMSSPRNWVKNNSYYLVQSYGIPLRRVRDEHFTIAAHPAVFIGHALEYNRWARRYEDTYAGTVYRPANNEGPTVPYYNDWNINPSVSRDSIFESKFANRVFVQIQPWNRNGVIGTIDAGIGVDMMRYYQFSPDEFLTGVKKKAVKETNYYAYAGIDGHIRQYFDWAAVIKYNPFGDSAGDLEIKGDIAARVFAKGRPLSISGNFRFVSQKATYWEENFYSNHYKWRHSFKKENETRFDVSLDIPHIGFSASASQSILGNPVYFGLDAMPRQAQGVVSVTGVYLQEDLKIGIKSSSLNLNHRVMLQWSSDQRVVPVPLVAAYLAYYYEFNVVKNVLRLQIGVEGRYNTRYYAKGYNPGTGQFYNQREKQLGDYIWMDVFVSAKWKRMRILLKMQHVNDDLFGTRNYFSVLNYPMNRRILKIGISWNMYD